jgi:hypothetical protein
MPVSTPKTGDFAEFCFPCMHVLLGLRPVRHVSRDEGDWIFACGEADHHTVDDWGYAHTFHLVDADDTLRAVADLKPGEQAARQRTDSAWLRLLI